MKRPLALFGLFYFLFQVAAIYLHLYTYAAIFTIIAVLCVLCFILNAKYKFAILVIFMACLSVLAVFNLHKLLKITPLQNISGQSGNITATVYNTSAGYNASVVNAKLIINNVSGGIVPNGGFKATAVLPAVSEGDVVNFNGTFENIEADIQKYYYTDYIFTSVTNVEDFTFTGKTNAFWYFAKNIQQSISARIAKYVPGNAGAVMQTMAVGNDTYLPSDIDTAFTRAGLSHVLVVSGMHLGIIGACVYFVCFAFIKSRISALLAIVVSVLFTVVAGVSPSSLRALLILVFYYGAKLICRKSDVFISLALAAIIMCAVNPYAAVDVGTLLSFSATFGVLCASTFLQIRRGKHFYDMFDENYINVVLQSMAIPIAATVFTLPVLIIFNMGFSVIGVFCNMVSATFVPFVTVGGMVLGFFGDIFILKPIALLFGLAGALNARALILIAKTVSLIDGAYIYASGMAATFCVLCIIFLFYVCYKNNYSLIKMLVIPVCFVLTCTGIYMFAAKNIVQVSLVGTSTNSSAVFTYQNSASVIFSGSAYNIDDVVHELEIQNIKSVDTVIDLRTSYDTQELEQAFNCNNVIAASEITNYKFVNLNSNIYADINHQANGNYACVHVGNTSVGIYSGTVDFSPYSASDILVASKGDAIALTGQTLWCTHTMPNWAANSNYNGINYADYILISNDTQRIKWGENSIDYK